MPNAQTVYTEEENVSRSDREPSDLQLLESYVARRDETSFATLVERYGGTVWRVCRRVLHQEQDAEDAFQAVFVLLSRKAASIHKPEAVGSWLYGVAYRTAMKAKRSTVRRQEREQRAFCPTPEQPPWSEAACRELQRILDEEVQHLGAKYRVPFVLCCLEGLTKVEAATELGWKEGTVSGRLTCARQLLQKRLARRGITLSAVLTAVTLIQSVASAAAPPVLLHTTVGALTGKATVSLSPKVVALADALLRTMAVAKVKAVVTFVLALTTLVAGAGVTAQKLTTAFGSAEPEIFAPPPVPLLKSIDEQVLAVAFSPDGKRLVTAGARDDLPGQLMIWDVATGKELVRIRGMRGIRTAVFSPDGQVLACGHFGGAITLRDPNTGQERRILNGHTVGVNGLAFSADSKLLLSAGLDRVVKLWDLEGQKEPKEFRGPTDRVVKTWKHVEGREEPKELPGHTGMIFSVAFFRHRQAFVSCSNDGKAIIWDIKTGKPKFILQGHQFPVETVAVSPDDKLVATASWDNTIKLWDADTGKESAVLKVHLEPVIMAGSSLYGLAFSPIGTLLASSSADGVVRLWDAKAHKQLAILAKHDWATWSVAFSNDGKLLASGSSDKTAKLWNVTTLEEVATLRTSEFKSIRALAYAPDGNSVGIAMEDKTVQLRDAQTGDLLFNLDGHDGTVNCLAFSPDGQTLASGGTDKTVRLWDPANGKEKRTLKGHAGGVQALAFSPDGKQLASGGDMTIKVWDPGSGAELAALHGHEAPIRALAFAINGSTLASGGADKTIRLWHFVKGTEPGTFQAHEKTVRALAFSGDLLASASDDGTVKVWKPAGGRLWIAAEGKEPLILKGHDGAVSSMAFLRGGRTLVSGGDDGNIVLWDPVSGESRGVLKSHREPVTALAVHPQGHDLLSGSLDTRVLRWQGARGRQVPVVEDPPSIAPPGKKEAKQVSTIEDVPKPRESYAKEYYHSFKDNPEDAKDFELFGPNADECVKFEPAGLRIVLPIGHPGNRLSTGVASRFAVKGDFEITLRYEILKEPAPSQAGQGIGLLLGVDLNTLTYNRATLTRGLRDRQQFISWFQLSHEGSDKPYRDELRVFPSAGMAARLRLVRTGAVLAHYVAEGTDDFMLLRHHPFGTEDVRTIRLGGQTGGPQASLDARLIDVHVRADSLPDMPDVPLAAQKAGAKLWLVLTMSILFSALVFVAVLVYARRRGAMPATTPAAASGNGRRANAVPPHMSFACSSCGKKLRARAALAGKKLKCPHCGLVMLLPSNTTSRAPTIPPAEHP
jgi:RNA polymerase sigma factor (sigma-70 family)